MAGAAGGLIMLEPTGFAKDKTSAFLYICLGSNLPEKFFFPDYIPALTNFCSKEEYDKLMVDLRRYFQENTSSLDTCCSYCSVFCCICTLGLSCLYPNMKGSSFKRDLEDIMNRHKSSWGAKGSAFIDICHKNSVEMLEASSADHIPVDQFGRRFVQNVFDNTGTDPEQIKTVVNDQHWNNLDHRQIEMNNMRIDMVNQPKVCWPPVGFSIRVRISDSAVEEFRANWPSKQQHQDPPEYQSS